VRVPVVAGASNRHAVLCSGASIRCSPKKPTATSVYTVAPTEAVPTGSGMVMPPRFSAGIRFTNVTVPPASTLASGGVRFRMSTVAVGAATATGAMRTEAPATPSQATRARPMPRRAVRRMRPVAMLCYLHVHITTTGE